MAFFEQQGHEGECAALATRGAEETTAEGTTLRLALALGRAEAAWRVEVFIMEADMVQSTGRRLREGDDVMNRRVTFSFPFLLLSPRAE